MSGKITDVFRQQKPHFERGGSSSSKQQQEQPGVCGAAAITNTDISPEERLLRQFDLDSRFGPCAGMTRLERWQRAEKFGLQPPPAVKQLLGGLQGEHWNKNLWDGRI